MTDELKPCPFCGGEGRPSPDVAWAIYPAWMVICPVCGGSGGTSDTEAEAIAAWNTRTEAETLASQARQIEALRGALEAIAFEAERENGGWVHLKRVIALKARTTLEETSRG